MYKFFVIFLILFGAIFFVSHGGARDFSGANEISIYSNGNECGNGIRERGEECDGNDKEFCGVAELCLVICECGSVYWNESYGGDGHDHSYSVIEVFDDYGNSDGYAVVGRHATLSGDNNVAYLLRLDDFGNEIFETTYGNMGSQIFGRSLVQVFDSDGKADGFAITGIIYNNGDADVILIRTTGMGYILWTKTYGIEIVDQVGYSIESTLDGGFIIGGSGSGTAGSSDALLIKTDENGNEEWSYVYGTVGTDHGYDVIPTLEGGYIIVGDTLYQTQGDYDLFVIKVDNLGIEEWSTTFGGDNLDRGYSIVQDNSGSYVIGGLSRSYQNGKSDFLFVKIDETGNVDLVRTFGGEGDDEGRSIIESHDGGYVIAGCKDCTIFDLYTSDMYVVSIDVDGNLVWEYLIDGQGHDQAFSISATSDLGYIVSGFTKIGNTPDGDKDIFVKKISLGECIPDYTC